MQLMVKKYYSHAQYSTTMPNTAQQCPIQHNNAQYSTTMPNTAQHA